MFIKTVEICNEVGLHARPASMFVQVATKYLSKITIEKEGNTANAKSIIEILTLGAGKRSKVIIKADGPDESLAGNELVALIQSLGG